MYRKEPMENGNYYHVLNRSIASFKIFNGNYDFKRMLDTLAFYRNANPPVRLSEYLGYKKKNSEDIIEEKQSFLVDIVCYCLMPTHIHLVLKQNVDGGISKFMQKVGNSYSKYFNIKHKRKGPLWESSFKIIAVNSDEQLLHLTRYIHLNPVSAGIIKHPDKWKHSSYLDYISKRSRAMCGLPKILDIDAKSYKEFVVERIKDQKVLSKIKKQLLENYTG